MRLPALLCAGALLVAALAQQASLPEPLATDLANLKAAKDIKVSYSFLVNGESQGKYQLEMAKDGLFRLTTPTDFVVGDGTNVYSYTKSSNSYSVAPENEAEVARFAHRPEVFGWGAFLEKAPGAEIESGTAGAVRTVRGGQVQDVDVVLKGGKGAGTVFVGTDSKVAQGFRLKEGDKLYLAVADSVEMPASASTPDKFAFVAPDGSKKVDATDAASGPSFGQVQQLMTDNCMPCHNSSNMKAGFDLSVYDGVAACVTPGDPAGSLMAKALRGNGVDLMPRGRAPLTEDQIQLVEKWIKAGAKRD